MESTPGRSTREGLVVFALVSAALYFTLLGYVFNHRGQGGLALVSALAAVMLVLPIYRSLFRAFGAR
jgi:hypothetical protein